MIALGFGDVQVPQARLRELGTELEDVSSRPDATSAVRTILARYAVPPEPARLLQNRAAIDPLFSHGSIEDILDALRDAGTDLAMSALQKIERMSPTSLKVTLEAIRRAEGLASLEEVLNMEYRLVCACLRHPDFSEGVRAAVIDKDRKPRWNPARTADVPRSVVEGFFEPHPEGDRPAARALPF
jgi:enoyl-CoA hydratase